MKTVSSLKSKAHKILVGGYMKLLSKHGESHLIAIIGVCIVVVVVIASIFMPGVQKIGTDMMDSLYTKIKELFNY